MGSISFSILFAVCFSLSVVAFLDRNAYGDANLAMGIIFFIVSIPFAALGSFAMLAMSGDLGGAFGPSLVGMAAQHSGDQCQYFQ